ncbi:unnamed protein product, partial [Linum tenue]
RTLSDRIRSLQPEPDASSGQLRSGQITVSSIASAAQSCENCTEDHEDENFDQNSLGSWKDGADACPASVPEDSASRGLLGPPPGADNNTSSPRKSWADMAQEDEFVDEEEQVDSSK